MGSFRKKCVQVPAPSPLALEEKKERKKKEP